MRLRQIGLTLGALGVLLGPGGAQGADPEVLIFGVLSTESQANQRPLWEPFVAAMERGIGISVKAFYVTQYAGVIEAMRFKKVDVALFGAKSYLEASRRAEAEAFALMINDKGGTGYYAKLVTHRDHPLAKESLISGDGIQYMLEHAAELTFAFNDPNSTSGFLVPYYYIFSSRRLDPKQVFKRVIFSGSHEANALSAAYRRVDVATINNWSLRRLSLSNPEAFGQLVAIWTSPEIPTVPIAYRKDLSEPLKARIREFFLTFTDEEVLGPMFMRGFAPTDDSVFDPVRKMEIVKDLRAVETNEYLEPDEKRRRIDALQQRLETLRISS
ncbi:MAG: phosphonate ABC transporter substrate-binding protein [SAR324 cluster bacterium]|nr:phosphonate ABC transporter substrate-binding protein [SAR324 cluster bacterium]